MAHPTMFSVDWVKSDFGTKSYLKSRVSSVLNGADQKETAIFRAAVYSMIDEGVKTQIHASNGCTFSARSVDMATFTKSLEKRCDQPGSTVEQGFQIFDSNPGAVLDRLQLLNLVELTEDLITDSSTILLNIDLLLPDQHGVVRFPAEEEEDKLEDDSGSSMSEDEDPPPFIAFKADTAPSSSSEYASLRSITFTVPAAKCKNEAQVKKAVYERITSRGCKFSGKLVGIAAAKLVFDLGFGFQQREQTSMHTNKDLDIVFIQRPVTLGSVFRRVESKLLPPEGSEEWNLLKKKRQNRIKATNWRPPSTITSYSAFRQIIKMLVLRGIIIVNSALNGLDGSGNPDAGGVHIMCLPLMDNLVPGMKPIDAPEYAERAAAMAAAMVEREREPLEAPRAKRMSVDNGDNTKNTQEDPYRIPVRLVGLGTMDGPAAGGGAPAVARQPPLPPPASTAPGSATKWTGSTIIDTIRASNAAINDIKLLLPGGISVIGTPSHPRSPLSSRIDLLCISGATGRVFMFDFKCTSEPESREIWKSLKINIFDNATGVYVHDCRWLGPALYRHAGIRLYNALDAQVAHGALQVVKGIGGGGGIALPCHLQQIFAEYGVMCNHRLHLAANAVNFFNRRPLSRNVQEFISHDTFHLYQLGNILKSTLGPEGTVSVLRMSKAYAETHLVETQKSYNNTAFGASTAAAATAAAANGGGGGSGSKGPTSDRSALPHGIPLCISFDQNHHLHPANYIIAPRDMTTISINGTSTTTTTTTTGVLLHSNNTTTTTLGGGMYSSNDDPAKNRDVATVLSLFPPEISEAVLALCNNTHGVEEPESGEIMNGDASTSAVQPIEKPKIKWPVEILVDIGRPISVRFSDGSEVDLDESLNFSVDDAIKMLINARRRLGLGSVHVDVNNPAAATTSTTALVATTNNNNGAAGLEMNPYGDQVHLSDIFSSDNRAGIPGTLHRISAIRGRRHEILGLTYRLGRHLEGVGALILDVLAHMGRGGGNNNSTTVGNLDEPINPVASTSAPTTTEAPITPSLLLLGPPGVGKSTLLRDVARILADTFSKRVVVVDTSNEIAGDGSVPHACIGKARRMMVPHRDRQHEVMKEAVQNHNPEVVIIDEIADHYEVAAAKTIAQRGVTLIGTAHGTSLDSIIKNPELNPLIGGLNTVILGDQTVRDIKAPKKTKTERKGAPCFTTIIELLGPSKWRIFTNVAKSVDLMLDGKRPESELRWIDADGRYMAQFEGGRPSPMDTQGLKAAQMTMRGTIAALAGGVEGGERVAWLADLALLASRYP